MGMLRHFQKGRGKEAQNSKKIWKKESI